MLLQPFVENAVKHGILQNAIDGKIIIAFNMQGNELVLTVRYNGPRFDTEKNNNGLGLVLSECRIALILVIQSTIKSTKISLTLTDWR